MFPNLFDSTLDRLVACHNELKPLGIKRVDRLPPSEAVDTYDMPHLFHIFTGMENLIPNAPLSSSGRIAMAFRFVVRTFVGSISDNTDVMGEGSKMIGVAYDLYYPFLNYYAQHPYLHLGSDPSKKLPYIMSEIRYQCSGIQMRPQAGGTIGISFDWTLQINLQAPAPSRAG